MILILLLVLSKCIKPYFKKQLYTNFSLVEDMIIYNFVFFIFGFLFYKIKNKKNILDITIKLNKKNIKLLIIYLLLTVFELYISNILINKETNISKQKILQKALYLILTPIIGVYLFNETFKYYNIIGLVLIILGLYISNL